MDELTVYKPATDNNITMTYPPHELKFDNNGDVTLDGRVLVNDKEIIEGLRKFLKLVERNYDNG